MKKEQLKRIDAHVGDQLKKLRILRGLSQEELASFVDLTFQQIQKYERGKNRVSASRMYQISKILKVAPHYFFDGLETTSEAPLPMLDHAHIFLIKSYDSLTERDRKKFIKMIKAFSQAF